MQSTDGNSIDRFEHFNDDERFLIAEALRTHLTTKQAVYNELRKDPIPSITHKLSACDFGIPALTSLLAENGF